jgi:hypothetical protein
MPHSFQISRDSEALFITLVTYSLWQTEKNVLPIFSEGMFMQKVNYIHLSPVRGELASGATEYRWSSARIWQCGSSEDEPLLVDVDRILC